LDVNRRERALKDRIKQREYTSRDRTLNSFIDAAAPRC